MQPRGDRLEGDVIVTTQVCENAPTRPHEPVPFMSSCVDQYVKNRYEVDPAMDAILSVDTTKGNRIINKRGFALSPTIKEGYILRMSEDLLSLMSVTTGKLPAAFPLTQQDITPYGNGLYHMNSILQPAFAAKVPVVGVAITTESSVPGASWWKPQKNSPPVGCASLTKLNLRFSRVCTARLNASRQPAILPLSNPFIGCLP